MRMHRWRVAGTVNSELVHDRRSETREHVQRELTEYNNLTIASDGIPRLGNARQRRVADTGPVNSERQEAATDGDLH